MPEIQAGVAGAGSSLAPGVAAVGRVSLWPNPSASEIQCVFSYRSLKTGMLTRDSGGGK